MKVDFSGLNLAKLACWIDAEYGLAIASLTFVPVGEVTHAYVAHATNGPRRFVRAQKTTNSVELETASVVTSLLRDRCGLVEAVAPYTNRRGTFTGDFAGYCVAVFPFVDGTTAFDVPLSDKELAHTASVIAAIHRTDRTILPPSLYRESFDNPFEAPIRRALSEVERLGSDANECKQQLRQLLRHEKTDILDTLRLMVDLRAEARRLAPELVLTHGDPNLANILVDTGGKVHLVDWDDVGIGPRERDLDFFTGECYEPFMRCYLSATGKPMLHPELFTFYKYRWALQEIADYSMRILFRNVDPVEDRHAWEEILPYLPVPHESIQNELGQIRDALRNIDDD